MSWQRYVTRPDGAQVAVFFVLPLDVYQEFQAQIEKWYAAAAAAPFNAEAAYNLVPVAFDPSVAEHYKIPFLNGPAPSYAESFRKNLVRVAQSDEPDAEKFREFLAFHSLYRVSLNHHKDMKALEIEPFINRLDLGYSSKSTRKCAGATSRPCCTRAESAKVESLWRSNSAPAH
jgi:hypothetical protein